MSATAAAPARQTYRLPWVEIFASGNHDGEDWTRDDLQQMADNYRRLRGKLDPPLVVGHEEDQQLLDATNLPAAGWITDLKVQWDPEDGVWKLGGPVEHMPPEVADWINSGMYRKVSAEIYDSPQQAGLPGEGKTLRRVALLGGELPKVKTLRSLPLAVPSGEGASLMPPGTRLRYSEGRTAAEGFRRITFFSERRPVDRNQLVQAALQLGIPQTVMDKLTDEELAAIVQAKAPPETPASGGNFNEPPMNTPPVTEPANMGGGDMPPTMDPTNPRPAGSYSGSDELRGKNQSGQLRAMWAKDPHGDYHPDAHAESPGMRPAPTTCADDSPSDLNNGQVAKMYAETRRLHAETQRLYQIITRSVHSEQVARQERLRQEHEGTVKAFCERMLTAKKVLPAEIDPAGPPTNLYHRLLRAGSDTRLHRFSEGGKTVQRTEFQLQMAEIEARNPAHLTRFFSEKMSQPGESGALSPDRRKQLLAATPHGRAVLKLESARK